MTEDRPLREIVCDEIVRYMPITRHGELLQADRAIAAVFDWMDTQACESWLGEDGRELVMQFLNTARAAAEKGNNEAGE